MASGMIYLWACRLTWFPIEIRYCKKVAKDILYLPKIKPTNLLTTSNIFYKTVVAAFGELLYLKKFLNDP